MTEPRRETEPCPECGTICYVRKHKYRREYEPVAPAPSGLLREAAERLRVAQETLDHCEDHDEDYIPDAYEARTAAIRDVIAALAAPAPEVDVERLARAIATVGKNMRLAAAADEIAAEYARLRENTEAYDKADHAAREGVPESDLP